MCKTKQRYYYCTRKRRRILKLNLCQLSRFCPRADEKPMSIISSIPNIATLKASLKIILWKVYPHVKLLAWKKMFLFSFYISKYSHILSRNCLNIATVQSQDMCKSLWLRIETRQLKAVILTISSVAGAISIWWDCFFVIKLLKN